MLTENSFVKGLPVSSYLKLWHRYIGRRPGFDSEEFLYMLKHFKFNGEFLTEDEMHDIYEYAIDYYTCGGAIITAP